MQAKRPQLPKSLLTAIRSVKTGCEVLAGELEEQSLKIAHEIVDPLEQYNKKYCKDVQSSIQGAESVFQQYQDLKNQVALLKSNYFKLKQDAELSELKIEESMLGLERGERTVEDLQAVSQQGLHLKYQAEIAHQNYVQGVTSLNAVVKNLPDLYKPCLHTIQQLEEVRIQFVAKFVVRSVQSI